MNKAESLAAGSSSQNKLHPPNFQALLIGGAILQLLGLLWTHPVAMVLFVGIGCLLMLAGIVAFVAHWLPGSQRASV